MGEVFVNRHPLVQHKITRLRDKTTGTNEFRSLVEEISMLMGYEALADLETEDRLNAPPRRSLPAERWRSCRYFARVSAW